MMDLNLLYPDPVAALGGLLVGLLFTAWEKHRPRRTNGRDGN